MDYPWRPTDGSEAQDIIRSAGAPPDLPLRPRLRRRSDDNIPNGDAAEVGQGGTGERNSARDHVSRIKLAKLLGKERVPEAMAKFLTLRDVFKLGSSCRELMNRLVIVSGPAPPAASQVAGSRPLLVHIRGAKEFLAYFRALEQQAAWTQQRMMAVSIVLDYHDSVDGPIPSFLGAGGGTNTVEWLDLGRSNLTGTIPDNLGTLPNLRKLYLAGNRLVGPIPLSLGSISTLSELSLAGNELSGSIPEEFGNLTLLRYLSLRDNKLTGPIPSSLGNLARLEELWLNANQISGAIPDTLGNMVTARKIFMNNNRIEGYLPATLGNLTSLEVLSLRHNRLTGTIPPELGRLTQLKTLYMEKNKLEGTIPNELAELASLEELNLLGNNFQGKVETRNLLIGRLPNCVVYV